MYKSPTNNVILDTNIWLYLSNGFDPQSNAYNEGDRHIDLLNQLKIKQDSGEICILVNDIIFQEWERNKDQTKGLIEKIRSKNIEIDRRLEHDRQFMALADIQTQQQINERTKANYSKEIEKNLRHIENVEHFLKHECKKIALTDSVKLQVWELAINKEAPFHRNKNNVADATILLSAIEYINSMENENLNSFFISNNTEDFCENKHSNDFHPQIQLLAGVNLSFERRLDKGLEISEEAQRELNEFYKEAYYESITFSCTMPNCQANENYQPIGYLSTDAYVVQERETTLNPDQLFLFEMENLAKKRQIARMGDCTICGTSHIECPVCDELIADILIGYDLSCPYCKTEFFLGYSFDDGTLELIIRDEMAKLEEYLNFILLLLAPKKCTIFRVIFTQHRLTNKLLSLTMPKIKPPVPGRYIDPLVDFCA